MNPYISAPKNPLYFSLLSPGIFDLSLFTLLLSRSKDMALIKVEAIVHTHKALLIVGIISIRSPQDSLITPLAPSE